jgi:hypothetical protein
MPAKPTGLRPQIHAPMICSCRPLPVSYKREQLMTCRPLGFDAPPSVWREGAREKLSREHRGSCCSSASAAAAWPSTAITARAVHSWPCYVALALSSRVSSPAYAAAHFLTQKRDLITGARAVQCSAGTVLRCAKDGMPLAATNTAFFLVQNTAYASHPTKTPAST